MYGRIKYLFKLIAAYINRFKLIIFIGIIAGASLFFLAPKIFPLFLISEEKIGITGRYHAEELPTFILEELSQGITKINSNGRVEPSLSSSWDTPDKGKTWVFHLRDDIYWQDGGKVKSEDISFKFTDVEIEKPDSATMIFKLKDIFTPFPGVLSKPVFKKGLLGTGEWKIKRLRISGSYVEELVLQNARRNKLVYRFYPTVERTKTAFKLGQIDKVVDVFEPSEFRMWPNVEISGIPNKNQVVTVFFNTQDKFLGDKTVRQALTYAIDKNAFGERALGPISPDSWAYNPQVKEYVYDVAHAKDILKDLPEELKNYKIKLISTPELLPVGERIAKDWNNVGVDASVSVSSFVPSEFQAFLTILDIPRDPDQYLLWHSTQASTNISKYISPRVDKLLEEGRKEINPEERRKIYLDFQRFLLEDLPAVFLYHPTYYTIIR